MASHNGVADKRRAARAPIHFEPSAANADSLGRSWALRTEAAHVWVMRDFLGPREALRYYEELIDPRSPVTLCKREIVLYGKAVAQPRLVGFAAESAGLEYRYSGATLRAQLWPAWMAALCARVNDLVGTHFNSVLINYYRDGDDYIAAHSDDEAVLGDGMAVAAIALGPGAAQRPLVFRPKRGIPGDAVEVGMASRALMVMAGNTQKTYTHEIRKSARPVGPRATLTFRKIQNT